MTDSMVNILAGLFARSNMGQAKPDMRWITNLKKSKHTVSLDSAVVSFCEEFMEEDSHYDIFMGEGQMWAEMLRKEGEETMRKNHPDMFALYDAA